MTLVQLVRAIIAINFAIAILVTRDALSSIFASKSVAITTDPVARQLVLASDAIPDAVAAMLDVHTRVVQTPKLLGPASEINDDILDETLDQEDDKDSR